MSVFVTVGTTKFDALVRAVDSDECLAALAARGYSRVLLQIGHGEYTPLARRADAAPGVQVTHYRHSAQYKQDVAGADLVISHAGAGSIMDALALRKPLVVVVNTLLMDNHQAELADAMAEQHYCVSTTCDELAHTLRTAELSALRAYPAPDEFAFPQLVDRVLAQGDALHSDKSKRA
ncbi:hypothetical protein PybrP1_004872 [[Pythium] brassicae (nom. inval.)]|nr:hypothetical protein PybrP1_004872 [[Pythium] brassicae (nom. inval.)]